MMSIPDKHDKEGGQYDEVPAEQPVEGRLYDSRNPEFNQMDSKDDISHVDQQEGEMNNGTTAMPGQPDHQEGKQDQ